MSVKIVSTLVSVPLIENFEAFAALPEAGKISLTRRGRSRGATTLPLPR